MPTLREEWGGEKKEKRKGVGSSQMSNMVCKLWVSSCTAVTGCHFVISWIIVQAAGTPAIHCSVKHGFVPCCWFNAISVTGLRVKEI